MKSKTIMVLYHHPLKSLKYFRFFSKNAEQSETERSFLDAVLAFSAKLLIPAHAGTQHPKGKNFFEEGKVIFGFRWKDGEITTQEKLKSMSEFENMTQKYISD